MIRPGCRGRQSGQALVEFACTLPVFLLLLLGMYDVGRALVFGVAVQQGAREAARLASTAAADSRVTDAAVWQRLIDASAPALAGCGSSSTSCTDGYGAQWTYALRVVTPGGATYSTLSSASSDPQFSGSQLTVTAGGNVSLFAGLTAQPFGFTLGGIRAQGQAVMVVQ